MIQFVLQSKRVVFALAQGVIGEHFDARDPVKIFGHKSCCDLDVDVWIGTLSDFVQLQ